MTTPEPCTTHPHDGLLEANIDVKPYRSEHARYMSKEEDRKCARPWKEGGEGIQRGSALPLFPRRPRHRQTRPDEYAAP